MKNVIHFMDSIDVLAEDILVGRKDVSGYSELNDMVEQVKSGNMSVEQFKRILHENKNMLLQTMS
jgi:hypothetical protein